VRVDAPLPPELIDAQVLDVGGAPHRLGDHIAGGLALVVWLRQFGCVGCNALVTDLAPRLLELHSLGVAAVFVGLGEPMYLAGFVERMRLADKKVTLFTDPTGAAHRAADLPRSVWASFSPRATLQRIRLAGQGFESGPVQGDPHQLSGMALIEAGQLRWLHVSDTPAGLPPAVEVVDRAMALAGRAPGGPA